MANIYPQNSSESSMSIFGKTDFSDPKKCPWVQINNLFVSVTTTGNESWRPIVEDQHEKGYRKFTVLSGRHGDQYGQPVSVYTGVFGPGVADLAHYSEDTREAKGLKLPGLEIEIINAGGAPHNTVKGLKDVALKKLSAGRTVIFAWCFSLMSMLEHPDAPGGLHEVPKEVLKSYMTAQANKSIGTIAKEDFLWVPAKVGPPIDARAK